ncbi:MAG: AraC family transcriptional regulator [Acidimicrobiales bacterium]
MSAASAPSNSPSVLIAWTDTLVRALESRGVDPQPLLDASGITRTQLADPEARLPLAASTRLWQHAVEATGDDGFGIEVSRHVTAGSFHAMGSAFLTSASLRLALERVARFSRITADVARGTVEETDGEFSLVIGWRSARERPAPAALDAVLAAIVRSARSLLGRELAPIALRLERPQPLAVDRFERFFGCPIEFAATENRLTFAVADADRPIPGGNERLASVSDAVVADYLAGLEPDTFLDDIRACLADALSAGEPALAVIASELAMSPRTLQRRIGEHGTTFRGVVADTRLGLATALLTNGVSVTETSLRVGFSETAAFSRAFRRWTGHAPSQLHHRDPETASFD